MIAASAIAPFWFVVNIDNSVFDEPYELLPPTRRQVYLGRGCFDRLMRDVVPQLFEPVVRARFGREDVQHDVDVVGDDPGRLRDAVDRTWQQIVLLLQAAVHLVPD